MRAISVWQPWASLIMCGRKAYETRSWRPPEDLIGQRIAIHAAKTPAGFERLAPHLCPLVPGVASGAPLDQAMPLGALLGTVRLAFVICTDSMIAREVLPQEKALGDWSPGRYAWRLEDPDCLFLAYPMRGQQRLFTVRDEIVEECRHA